MTELSVSDRSPAVYEPLSRRCAELGIALWHCDAGGRVLAEPRQPQLGPALRQWLGSAPIRQRIESVASLFTESRTVGVELPPIEALPGQWLLPLEQRQGIRRAALFVAMVFTTDAVVLPAPTVVYRAADIPRLHRTLRWFCEDLERSERDGRTIDQFSEKLGQAYEETHLLYRMARLINCVSDAAQAVQSIGQQLQEVLPFGWLAIRFSQHSRSVRELSGRMLIAGQPPCDPEQIRLLSDPLLQQQTEAGWKKLLRPGDSALAAATGAEVLAEPITHDGQVIGLLLAGNKRGPDPELSSVEMQFLDATADFLGVFHENLARFAEQREMFFGTLRALTASIDAKDRYTAGHSERVGLLASKLAAAMNLDRRLVEEYRIAGMVHDVGKIGVPEAVLCKPGKLTAAEFAQIKRHPEIGHRILKDIPALAGVLPGVLWHHERWDGGGYPHQLAAEKIPLIARVLALADTFDAMSSTRSYRPAMPRHRVLEEIRVGAGTQFDPELAPLFVTLDFSDFDRALESHRVLEQRAA